MLFSACRAGVRLDPVTILGNAPFTDLVPQGDKENGGRRARLIGLVFKRACEAPRPTSTLAAKKKKARAPTPGSDSPYRGETSPGSPHQGESKVRKGAATHALKFKQVSLDTLEALCRSPCLSPRG